MDTNDYNKVCPEDTKSRLYMHLNDTTITVCPDFWKYIGNAPLRTCADLHENIVSWEMTFAGDLIHHMLLSYIGEKAVFGKNIVNWQIPKANPSDPDFTGALNALFVRKQTPGLAKWSESNYTWYALVGVSIYCPCLVAFMGTYVMALLML